MKILRQTLFILILIVGGSVAIFAQSNDNTNKPKGNPPSVPVQPKGTPRPPSNDSNSNKPQKPSAGFSGNLQTITLLLD